MASRKAQVTLFVVAAVIVVVIASIFFMFRAGIVKAPMSTEQAKKLLDSRSENLKDYTAECIEKISNDYFQKILLHGGYYRYDSLYKLTYLGNDNVILLNDDIMNYLPSLDSICGEGFEIYLAEEGYDKLDECLKDFSTFKKDMDINPSSERKITADCRDEDIVLNTDWLLDISRADASAVIQQKDAKLLIPLRRMWMVANDILIDESEGHTFSGGEIEGYLSDYQNSLNHLLLESWLVSGDLTLQHITSIPYRYGEEQNKFIFAHNTPII